MKHENGVVICGFADQVVEIVHGLYGDRRSVRGENNRSRGLRRGISSRSSGFTRGFQRGFQGTARGSRRGFQGSTRGSRRGFQPRGGNFNRRRILSRGRVTKYKWRGGRSLHHGKGYRSDVPCPELLVALRMVKSVENDVNGWFLLCQGGLTSQSLRDALVRTFIDFERKDVLVMIGTNDLLQDVPCPVILSNIDAVLQELCRKKVGEIYLCNVAAIPKVLENCPDELLALNEKLMERNSLENSVNVIDCSAVFMVDGGFNEMKMKWVFYRNLLVPNICSLNHKSFPEV
ncbi:Glucan endo-1,3-beta-glucosidase 1 [Frankliniella fusca]|uniref:Glucan endo-1,3-beta-glucosidase 1 n=1 Tax=Frankliniella fusca TaxID=407009 RepID=A0AAE1LV88_9NEOP|nr:Glucan endo-1,3-beta-glucosidase 1 [Frankliniella fusca]